MICALYGVMNLVSLWAVLDSEYHNTPVYNVSVKLCMLYIFLN